MSVRTTLIALWLTIGTALPAVADAPSYALEYRARFLPEEDRAAVSITVRQSEGRLTLVDLNAPEHRFHDFEGDGDIDREGDRLQWKVPADGGELRYRTTVDHKRDDAYDARLTDDWAILRLDDLFPPIRSRSRPGVHAETTLYLEGPQGWSFETPYGRVREAGVSVDTAGRRFDRPVGWMAAGDLGTRRADIAGRRFVITGPKDEGFRRLDLLTFLHWTVPDLVKAVPSLPSRVLIVGGSQDMWRGGLSGPASLYVHPDRPLVSGNATSTFLHELVHVATAEPPADGDDWIAEGLAEYYSLEVLRRTGGISQARYQGALEDLREWVDDDGGELSDPSTGEETAAAVLMFRDLDQELRKAGASLDDVAAELLAGAVNRDRLSELSERLLGKPSRVLACANMPDHDD